MLKQKNIEELVEFLENFRQFPSCRKWGDGVMRNIHIPESYDIWQPRLMKQFIRFYTALYTMASVVDYLNRPMWTLIVEWWLHNIGYYITKPFCKLEWCRKLNERFRDVDLEEWN